MNWLTFCKSVLLIFTTNKIGFLMMIGAAIGLILGVGLEHVELSSREIMYVGFLAELFIQMLKAIAIPLMSVCIILAFSSIGKELTAKLRFELLLYVTVTKIESTLLGIALAMALKPGKGYKRSEKLVRKSVETVKRNHTEEVDELLDLVRNIFPDNWILTSMKRSRTYISNKNDSQEFGTANFEPLNLLGIVSICMFIGIAVRMVKLHPKPFVDFLNCITDVSLAILRWVLFVSPLFLISLVAHETLKEDAPFFLTQIALYLCTYLAGFFFQITIFYPLIYVIFIQGNPYNLIRQLWDAIKIAIRTSSSKEALPTSVTCLKENSNFNPTLVDYVVPLGQVINKDGCCLLFGIAFILIAQDSGIDLKAHDYIHIFVMSIAGSIAALGIPQGCLMISTALLQSAELQVNSICILFTVDWLIDRFQTVNNVIGNAICVATLNHINKKFLAMETGDNQGPAK